MPYTKEELQELEFYQNLIVEDELRYLNERQIIIDRALVSGSADTGQTARDEEGNVLIFESPYTGELQDEQNPTSMIVATKISDNLRNDISINEIISRTFGEL